MKNKFLFIFIINFFSFSSLFASNVTITNDLTKYFKTPDQLKWGNPQLFDKGAHDSVMYMKPDGGPYTVRVKFPANFKVNPFYQTGEIYLTVLSGTLYINSGTKFNNQAKGYKLPQGSFFSIPANMAVFMWTNEEPVIIQMHSPKLSKVVNINHSKKSMKDL